MSAVKEIQRYLRGHPGTANAWILAHLTTALVEEREFPLGALYALDPDAFRLAIDLIRDWPVDRENATQVHGSRDGAGVGVVSA